MKTEQEIFNEVSAHLLQQGERSLSKAAIFTKGTLACAYRGDNGLKCAAGKLICDEFYKPEMETQCAERVIVSTALYKSGVPPEAMQLVIRLQIIHDDCSPNTWEEHLQELAKEFGLN